MGLPSSNQVIAALIADGFHPRGKSGRGSHQVFRKELPDGARNVVVPLGKRKSHAACWVAFCDRQAQPQDTWLTLLSNCTLYQLLPASTLREAIGVGLVRREGER